MPDRNPPKPKIGKVYLVGAGPGDPKLITVRGAEVLARADVVVNDRLANPRLLKYAPADAEIVYAGKASRDHFLKQDEIIDLLIDRARKGKTVVRLKGGDPFVFGRGGEEAEALAEAGIEFEIVPGISSSVAVPAYAGIPVTGRFQAASFGVVTAHEAPGKGESDIKWDKIATGLDTLVFLMGVENLENVARRLVENGRSADTPVAVIQWGTHPRQRTVVGTLASIVDEVKKAGLTPPAVTIVGETVRMRESIAWFEKKPLLGKQIIVTRAQSQSSALTAPLEELGAEVDEYPVIKFVPPADFGPIDAAIERLGDFDWVLFTSANGVEWFVDRLSATGGDIRALAGCKLGAIGPKTAAAVERLRLRVDYVPSKFIAESVVGEFPDDVSGKSILIPRAKEAREELPDGLRAKGAEVVVACAYETVIDTNSAEALRERLVQGVDVITFTSASTVDNFFELIGESSVPEAVLVACIGPITADAARAHGLEPAVIAEEYTIEGLIDALVSGIARVR